MSYASERASIEARWNADMPGAVTQYENVAFTVPTDGEWYRLTIANTDAEQISAGVPGSNVQRHIGVIAIRVAVKAGTGTQRARELAEAGGAVFRCQLIDNILCRTPTVRIGDVDGGWLYAFVTVPFQRDEFF